MVYRRTFLFISFILISILFATSQADAAYKIQQGRVQVTSNQQDIPITAVSSMSKAFVIIDRGTGWRDGNCDADDTCVRGMLQAVDNIRVYRTSSSNSSWISYQVIECTKDEFTVYRNSGSFAAGSGDTSASIGATVTPSNCFAWVTADNNQGNQTHFAGSELTAYVDSSTTVRIQRAYTTTAAVNYNWVVVEFDPDRIASIQTGESLVTTHNESSRYNQSISEVDLDTSMLFLQHRTDANGITHAAIAGTFNSATQISFYKYTTYSSNSSVRWYVIDFGGDADAQRNQIDNSSDSGWYTEDVTLSPTVVLANTIVFHSMGCNGTATGTAYPRPYATNLLTSTSNLRIERIRQGQQTYNEWQVLQMPTCSYIDIDGTVYTNEAKSANVGANKTIALSVNGDAVQTAETDSNGSFSFTDVQVYPDDVLLLYIDDETENGSFVTITDSLTDFTGASEIDMYTDKVVLHHQTGTEITNTELDVIDGVDAGDEDGITITGSDVEFASGFEVWVESGATYTPGGDVEADSFEVAGTGTFAPGANFITIHGNWTVSATGVFTISGGATFDGSGTQVITTGGTDASHDFEDLTHSGSGTFQLAASSDLDVNESLTKSGSGDIDTQGRAVTAKWLFMEAGTFNTSGDAGSWNINGDVELNGGTLTATSGNFNIQGDFLNSAAFVHNSGTLIFDATSGSVLIDAPIANGALGNVTLNDSGGGVTFTLSGPTDFDGSITVTSGTLDADSNNMNVGGDWTVNAANGIFTSGTNIVYFDGSGVQVITTGGTDANHDFEDLEHSGSGTFQIEAASDLDVNESITQSGSGDFDTQGRAVTAMWLFMEAGTFNTSGDGGSWNINGDVEINGGTLTATSGNFNIQGDFLNSATFVHNSGTLIFDATSGSVLIDAPIANGALGNVTLNDSGGGVTFTLNGPTDFDGSVTVTSGTLDADSNNMNVGGNWTVNAANGIFTSGINIVYFDGTGTQVVTTGGTDANHDFEDLEHSGSGTFQIEAASDLDVNESITQSGSGDIDTQGRAITATALFVSAGTFNTSGDAGAWDVNGDVRISGGTITNTSGNFNIFGSFTNAGTLVHNSGTVIFDATGGAPTINAPVVNGAFNDVTVDDSTNGITFTLATAIDLDGDLLITDGTLDTASHDMNVGGGWDNNSTFIVNTSKITFDAGSTGHAVETGGDDFYDVEFSNASGGWTIQTDDMTCLAELTITSATAFTLASGRTLEIQGQFTNSVGGAATTWTGSTLYLNGSGSYTINESVDTGDTYATLHIAASQYLRMWNSSASTYTIDAGGSLYSMDHAASNGDLYVFGEYTTPSDAIDYWNYANDFDGTPGANRTVNVRIDSGASVVVGSGETLQILGGAADRTAIDNQGSGNYAIEIDGGTLTAQYFDFDNFDQNGLSISGSSYVTELSDGSFDNIGAGTDAAYIKVQGSVMVEAKTFSNNDFDPGTVDTNADYNVFLHQTPAFNWYFDSYTGNLGGESNDKDDGGDPGYIVWSGGSDDSTAAVITIEGYVYANDNDTGPISGVDVRVAVNTSLDTDYDTTDASGYFQITNVDAVNGDMLTLFLDGGTYIGSTVSYCDGSNIGAGANFRIYQDHVTIRHETAFPMTINRMARYDSSDDPDINYTATDAATDTLVIDDGSELLVALGYEFAPNGDLQSGTDGIDDIEIRGTFTCAASEVIRVSGTWVNSGTFTAATSEVIFDAASGTEDINSTGATLDDFYDITFDGAGTFELESALDVINDVLINAGTLDSKSGVSNSINVGGSWDNNATFQARQGTVTFDATAGSPTIDSSGATLDDFYDIVFNDAGNGITFTLNSTLDVNNDVVITNGELDANTQTINVGGSWDNNSTFTANNSTVIFDSSSTGKTIESGDSDFYDVEFGNGSGGWTIQTEDFTALNDFVITSVSGFTLESGRTLEIQGQFDNSVGGAATTWTGTTVYLNGSGSYEVNARTDPGDTYATLRIGASQAARMWYSDAATTYTIDAGGSLYSMDHANSNGDLYIWGTYTTPDGSTDYWNYANDFDGTAGANRTVNVRVTSGASITVGTGETLQMLGGASNRTSVDNQGSGNYALEIDGGTINAQYYDFDNLDYNGLSISGNSTVTELANGSFDNMGAGTNGAYINVEAASIASADTFANIVFDDNADGADPNFGGDDHNIFLHGSAGYEWTFSSASGNAAGEAYDNDPAGDPGYLIWDDSISTNTVAGTAYTDDDEATPVPEGTTVTLAVNGNVKFDNTDTTDALGAFTIPNVSMVSGDVLTLFFDGEAFYGTVVTIADGSALSGINIYEAHVILRYETGSNITIANMAAYDNAENSDINFTAVDAGTDTLTVEDGSELFIPTGYAFQPGGDLESGTDGIDDIEIQGTLTCVASENIRVSGTWINSGTFTASTSTVTFDAALGTEDIDSTGAALDDFYNIEFDGSGTFELESELDVNNDFTVLNGTVDAKALENNDIYVAGDWANSDTFTAREGKVIFDAESGSPTIDNGLDQAFYDVEINDNNQSITFLLANELTAANDINIAGGTLDTDVGSDHCIWVGGDWVNSDEFISNDATVSFNAVSGTQTIDAGGTGLAIKDFQYLAKIGGGTLALSNTALEIDGIMYTAAGCTVYLNGQNITLGELNNAGIFQLQGGETVSLTTMDDAKGAISYVGNGDGIGDTHTITGFGASFYDLRIEDGNATKDTFQLTQATDIKGDLQITGGTFDASSYDVDIDGSVNMAGGTLSAPGTGTTLTVGDDFAISSGTFTHNSGEVILDDNSNVAVINAPATGLTFYDFTCTTASKVINFTAGDDFTVSHDFTVQGGGTSTRVDLNSTSSGTRWYLILNGSYSVQYVDVQDSEASGTAGFPIDPSGSNNSGNNVNWFPIGESDSDSLLRSGADRHTFYDGSKYWLFYIDDNDDVVYKTDTNGDSWEGAATTVATGTYSSLGIWQDGTYVYVAYTDGGGLFEKQITIAGESQGSEREIIADFMMEWGVESSVGDSASTVNTINDYGTSGQMVVVASVDHTNNDDTRDIVTRVDNAANTSFDVDLERLSSSPAAGLSNDPVRWMVTRTTTGNGVQIPGGSNYLEAQTYTSTVTDRKGSWAGELQTYQRSWTGTMAVVGQVLTINDADPDWSAFWCMDGTAGNPPSTSTIYTGKTVCEDTDTTRANETVGWIATNEHTGTLNGIPYEVQLSPNTVEEIDEAIAPYAVTLQNTYTQAPEVAVVALNGMNGGDGGWAVLDSYNVAASRTTTTLYPAAVEDHIADNDGNHAAEEVAYWTFEETGGYYGGDVNNVQIIKDTNNYFWVKWENSNNDVFVAKSSNPNDEGTWDDPHYIIKSSTDSSNYGHCQIVPLTLGHVLYVYQEGNSIYSKDFTDPASQGSAVEIVTDCATGDASAWNTDHYFSIVADDAGYAYLIYVDSVTGYIEYAVYDSAVWSTPISVSTAGSCTSPTLSYDLESETLIALWIEGDEIKYGRSTSILKQDWQLIPSTLQSGLVSPAFLSSAYTNGSPLAVVWREGETSPYTLQYDTILLAPTIVDLVSFNAIGNYGKVMVVWETDSELRNAGFNVYRSTDPEEDYVKVNNVLIPGLGDSARGKKYTIWDTNVVDGDTYYYKLEDVEYDGTTTLHGPVSAHPGLDSDNDVMTDDWERYYGLDPFSADDAAFDTDNDGDSNLDEFMNDTDPTTERFDESEDPEEPDTTRDGVNIIRSDDWGVELELITTAFESSVKSEGDEVYQTITLPYIHGYTTAIGGPQIPLKGVLLGVPVDAEITISVEGYDPQVHSGYTIYPVPRTYLEKDLTSSEAREPTEVVRYEFVKDESVYAQDGFIPAVLAEIAPAGDVRGQDVAKVQIYPVQFDPVTHEVVLYKRVHVIVDFGTEAEIATSNEEELPESFQDVFKGVFSNYMRLKDWKRRQNDSSAVDSYPPDNAYKIAIKEEGLYKISRQDLVDAGINVSTADPRNFRLYGRGREVLINVHGESDGSFDANDYIEFYGEKVDTRYTGTNIYWLTLTERAPLRVLDQRYYFLPGKTPQYVMETIHFEKNESYWMEIPDQGYVDDHWFFLDMLWAPCIEEFTVPISGVANVNDDAIVTVALQGMSHVFDGPDHHTKIYLNDILIDESIWEGDGGYLKDITVPQSCLLEGDNTIGIELVGDTGAGYDVALVNWFNITYTRQFRAENNKFQFTHSERGLFTFKITGFTEPNIAIYDITDPANVIKIIYYSVTDNGGEYTVAFRDNIILQPEKRYLIVTTSAIHDVLNITQNEPSALHDTDQQADYIIITHDDFYDNIQPLAEHRYLQGLNVKTVKVEDIYDEFNWGIFDPAAIKKFLAYAYNDWQEPAPSYVLLVGDATYDYRDHEGFEVKNFVPTYLVHSLEFGETATDNWFVCLDGDNDILPEMLIGRIPAYEPEQVDDIVNKILRYENAPSGEWSKKISLVADNIEDGFMDISEEIAASLPSDYSIYRLYLDWYPKPADCREDIIAAFNDGTVFMNYVGHGSVVRWAHENIFQISNIRSLHNESMLPLVTAMCCGNGYFIYPSGYFNCLAEELLYAPFGGAVAVIAPTGISITDIQAPFNKALVDNLFKEDRMSIGAAAMHARIAVYENYGKAGENVIQTFPLFGDPALMLKRDEN